MFDDEHKTLKVLIPSYYPFGFCFRKQSRCPYAAQGHSLPQKKNRKKPNLRGVKNVCGKIESRVYVEFSCLFSRCLCHSVINMSSCCEEWLEKRVLAIAGSVYFTFFFFTIICVTSAILLARCTFNSSPFYCWQYITQRVVLPSGVPRNFVRPVARDGHL